MRMNCTLTYTSPTSGRTWTVPWTTEIEPPRLIKRGDDFLHLVLRVTEPQPLESAQAPVLDFIAKLMTPREAA